MISRSSRLTMPVLLAVPLLLAGCATTPSGPSVMVLPGTNKSFDTFRADEMDCRHYAEESIDGTPGQAGVDSGVKSAVVGTVIGAAAGAALGGSDGAAVGAGTGLLIGSAAGADAAQVSSYGAQRRYDIRYTQCMYAKGHRVPVSGNLAQQRHGRDSYNRSRVPPDYVPPDYVPPTDQPYRPPPAPR